MTTAELREKLVLCADRERVLFDFALHVLDELDRAEAEYRTYSDADNLLESEIADIRSQWQHTYTLRDLVQKLEALL